MTWAGVYEEARARRDSAAGFYNDNVRVETAGGPVNVRIPIGGAETMDLRLWPEEAILRAVAGRVGHVPRLLYAGDAPRFQVHGFIEGDVLNDLAPRGTPVPAHVPGDVVRLLAELTAVPLGELPGLPEGWPRGDDTAGFARRLSALTEGVWRRFRGTYRREYAAFGFPDEPLAAVEDGWAGLARRPFVCVHSDIHRKNIILRRGACHFLDWELALWGDPVYDLAVHLHKMVYLPAERDHVVDLWRHALPADLTGGWEHDLGVYLAHEQIKSAIVDTVRTIHILSGGGAGPDAIPKLTTKLNNAYRHWGLSREVDDEAVRRVLL